MTTILRVTNEGYIPAVNELFQERTSHFLIDDEQLKYFVAKFEEWQSGLGICPDAVEEDRHHASIHVYYSTMETTAELPEPFRFPAPETYMYVFVPVLRGCYGCCIVTASSIEEANRLLEEDDDKYDSTTYKLLEQYPADDGTMSWKKENQSSFYLKQAVRIAEAEHKVHHFSYGDTVK